jgi:hypothetical protein
MSVDSVAIGVAAECKALARLEPKALDHALKKIPVRLAA